MYRKDVTLFSIESTEVHSFLVSTVYWSETFDGVHTYETCVFSDLDSCVYSRDSTLDDAKAAHRAAIELLRAHTGGPLELSNLNIDL